MQNVIGWFVLLFVREVGDAEGVIVEWVVEYSLVLVVGCWWRWRDYDDGMDDWGGIAGAEMLGCDVVDTD